jgi:hypothetical protein
VVSSWLRVYSLQVRYLTSVVKRADGHFVLRSLHPQTRLYHISISIPPTQLCTRIVIILLLCPKARIIKMKAKNGALYTPLLGDELIDNNEESLLQVAHKDDDKKNVTLFGVRSICWDFVFLSLIQCPMTWSIVTASPILGTTVVVPYSLQFVTNSIATFGISTWLYRRSCTDCPKNIRKHCDFVLELPELLASIIIFILVTLGKIGATLVALHCGSLLLCLLALGMTVHHSFATKEQEKVEQLESSQVGILTV